jgi:antitoxin (DNA-binding transcriptional repressor) of toxin-antitoxin stability system
MIILTFSDWSIYWSYVKQESEMSIEIGSYEAKTKLPKLLRGVRSGNRYTITLRGEPIADLGPPEASHKNDVGVGVARMLQLMESSPPILNVNTKALIEEGRD